MRLRRLLLVLAVTTTTAVLFVEIQACGSDGDMGAAGTDAGRDATARDTAPDASGDAPEAGDAARGEEAGSDVATEAAADVSDAGATAEVGAPSCAAGGDGLTTCGPGESCCTSLPVPGGSFYRTYDSTGPDGGAVGLADPATVSAFRLDKYEVTVARFRAFVAAWGAGWRPTPGSGKHTHLHGGAGLVNGDTDGGVNYETGWVAGDTASVLLTDAALSCPGSDSADAPFVTWTASPGPNEARPMNCVSWYESVAFCIWDGAFLPSEAEWLFAAAGGDEQREYPWGSADPGRGSTRAVYGCFFPDDAGGFCRQGTSNIGTEGYPPAGAGRWGHLGLGGNVYEWVPDWGYLDPIYYTPCVDCAGLTPITPCAGCGPYRSIRDAYWGGGPGLVTFETASVPTGRAPGMGLRCARTP